MLFAEDVALFADSVIRLQRLINCTKKYCNAVGMKINLDKTKIVHFTNGGTLKTNEVLLYKGEEIQVISLYKYLAILITPKRVCSKTIEMLSKQATSCILRYQSKFGHFHPKSMFKLFDSMVKSRKENPQKLTQLSSRSHPRHLVGKRTAQKDITIDTTSDSQVNSNFPNRWSPASLTFNNYFYLF